MMNTDKAVKTEPCKVPWCNRNATKTERCDIHAEVHKAYASKPVTDSRTVASKITNEQIESQELYSLGEVLLDGNLELNEEFIKRYCGQAVAVQLLRLPEKDRAYALEGNLGEGYFPGGIGSLDEDTIVLPHGEIEFQFEGEASEVFETPDDLTINGNLAYLYTGYGAVFQVDIDGLTKAVDEQLNP